MKLGTTVALSMALSAALLSACASLEPAATSRFQAPPGTSADAVFRCAESAIQSRKQALTAWNEQVTTRNAETGLLETGHFAQTNISGIRTQISYAAATGEGRIKIKASGAYFVDLGAEQAATQLASDIKQCL